MQMYQFRESHLVEHDITMEPYLCMDSQFSHTYSVTGSNIHWDILFSPNGKLLVFSEEFEIIVLNGKSFEFLYSFTDISSSITSIRFIDRIPLMLISGHQNGSYKIWDMTSAKIVYEFHGHSTSILSLANNKDLFFTGCRQGKINIWKTSNAIMNENPFIGQLSGHAMDVHDMIVLPENDQLLLSAGRDGNVILWNLHEGKSENLFKKYNSIWSMCHSGCRTCLIGYQNGTVERFDYYTGQTLKKYHANSKSICGVMRLGEYVYSTSQDGYVMVYDIHSGWIREIVPGFTGEGSISASNHKFLAQTALKETCIRIWKFKVQPWDVIDFNKVFHTFSDLVFDL